MQIGKEEDKLPLLANDMILNIEKPKEYIHTHTNSIRADKLQEQKINIQRSILFLHICNVQPENEI